MSVRVSERGVGKLEVINAARKLAEYTVETDISKQKKGTVL